MGDVIAKRRLKNWVESWEEYVSCSPSPILLRRWSAISLIAGAIERKCWVRTMGRNLYPNLYVIMIAPPGVGKSFLTATAWEFWEALGTHHLAASSITKAALVDCLADAERHIIQTGAPTTSFNSLLVVSNELGVLLPSYENDFMNTLTDIYDGHPYSERRRTRDLNIQLKSPQINLLASTTPAYLNHMLPEGAWDQGFLSRCLLVYSGESLIGDLFKDAEDDKTLRANLIHDLKLIAAEFGQFTWAPDAQAAMQQWHTDRGPPQPDHPKLAHYCTRRTAHLLKLCQIASITDSNEHIITLEHFQCALDWLIEVEFYMPDIFKAMSQGGDAQLIKECWHFAYKIYVKEQKPIQEYRIIRFLQERTPSHNVERIVTIMVRGQLFRQEEVNKVGPCLVPAKLKEV